jgi:hypothetical protein
MCSAIVENMAKIALGRSGLQICLYLVTGSRTRLVIGDLCTYGAHM